MYASFAAFHDVRAQVNANRGGQSRYRFFPYDQCMILRMRGVSRRNLIELCEMFASFAAGSHMVEEGARVKANCFHFVRQVTILQRSGAGSAETQFSVPWLKAK